MAVRPARPAVRTHGRLSTFAVALVAGLGACGDQSSPDAAVAPSAARALAGDTAVRAALATTAALWHDDDRARHPKGSCAGCHGPDWFDLARIGSTDTHLRRRALLDGATAAEAEALVAAVRETRRQHGLRAADARAFRPFQPGGAPLPGATPRDRDVAFAEQLARLAPTLMGAPVTSVAAARRALAELADLVRGTNAAGANPRRLTPRTLPTGVVYARWSADHAHGVQEATLNDWVADVARDPRPEGRAEWQALVRAYLARPDNGTFWAMYAGVDRLLRPIDSTVGVRQFLEAKHKSALLGQHLLRMEAAGRTAAFAHQGVAFAYLDTAANRRSAGLARTDHLPSALWDVADHARGTFGGRGGVGAAPPLMADALRAHGAPAHVAESVDPAVRWEDEAQAVRLAWFWIGWTFEPTLLRSGQSNSTRSGEYIKQTLHRAGMPVHRAFVEAARQAAARELPAGRRDPERGTVAPADPVVADADLFEYGHWRPNWERNDPAPMAVRERQQRLHARLLGNLFRAQALVHLDAHARGLGPHAPRTGRAFHHVRNFFVAEHPATVTADTLLLRRVAVATGVTY